MKFLNGGGGGGAGNEIIDRNFNRHIQRLIKKHNISLVLYYRKYASNFVESKFLILRKFHEISYNRKKM